MQRTATRRPEMLRGPGKFVDRTTRVGKAIACRCERGHGQADAAEAGDDEEGMGCVVGRRDGRELLRDTVRQGRRQVTTKARELLIPPPPASPCLRPAQGWRSASQFCQHPPFSALPFAVVPLCCLNPEATMPRQPNSTASCADRVPSSRQRG